MLIHLKQDWKGQKAGTRPDVTPVEAADMLDHGIAVSIQAADMEVKMETMEANRRKSMEQAITAKVAEAKARKAIVPKDEAVLARGLERLKTLGYADEAFTVVCETIDSLKASEGFAGLSTRITSPVTGEGGSPRISVGAAGLPDMAEAYIAAREPVSGLVKGGDFKGAFASSREAGAILASACRQHGDGWLLRDAIKAADYTDPNSQVGTLATGLVLMRNLGFLKNKLNWLPYFTTDLRNEPAMFGQPVFTRYITPPNVATFIPGVGFTTDATTISNASATAAQSGIATQTSGTRTLSTPSTTDRTVTMNQFKGVSLSFPVTTLGATARNLFAEQRDAQLYSLAEKINGFVLDTIFAATWTGTVASLKLGSTFAVPGMVTVKNRMTLSKIPDIGRFALMHSTYHDALLSDTNLLTAKAILALINKDASSFEQAEVPSLFGVKPLESQLASYAGSTQTAPNIDASTGAVDFTGAGITKVGFAGNMSSALFVARVPQDFTQAAAQLGIPSSWAVEIVTEPDSGLSVMIFKNVNTSTWAIEATVCLMYGAAQGDPRVGIVLTP